MPSNDTGGCWVTQQRPEEPARLTAALCPSCMHTHLGPQNGQHKCFQALTATRSCCLQSSTAAHSMQTAQGTPHSSDTAQVRLRWQAYHSDALRSHTQQRPSWLPGSCICQPVRKVCTSLMPSSTIVMPACLHVNHPHGTKLPITCMHYQNCCRRPKRTSCVPNPAAPRQDQPQMIQFLSLPATSTAGE